MHEKIKCKRCGALNDNENIFCIFCETVLTNTDSGKDYIKKRKKEKRRARILLVLIILFSGLFIVGKHYQLTYDRIQGIWTGGEGTLLIKTYGEADISETTFVPEGTYKWKVHLWNNLKLTKKNDPEISFEFKMKFDPEENSLQLIEAGDSTKIYEFNEQSYLIYTT